jgi:hypothetical protein
MQLTSGAAVPVRKADRVSESSCRPKNDADVPQTAAFIPRGGQILDTRSSAPQFGQLRNPNMIGAEVQISFGFALCLIM